MEHERFVIVRNRGEVSILDTGHDLVEEEGNLLLFSIDFEDNEVVPIIVAEELESVVKLLNEQDKLIKSLS